jgi:hypothetical protein
MYGDTLSGSGSRLLVKNKPARWVEIIKQFAATNGKRTDT